MLPSSDEEVVQMEIDMNDEANVMLAEALRVDPEDNQSDHQHEFELSECTATGCRRGGPTAYLPIKQCVVCDSPFHNPSCGGPRLRKDRECCEGCFLDGSYHIDKCCVCGEAGDDHPLFRCESCRNSAHPACVGLPPNAILDPLDNFSCDKCACSECHGAKSHVGVTSSCIKCRYNYHSKCVPRGSSLVDEREGFIRCAHCSKSRTEEHTADARKTKRSKRQQVDSEDHADEQDEEYVFEDDDADDEEEEEEEEDDDDDDDDDDDESYEAVTRKRKGRFELESCAYCGKDVPNGSPECDSCYLPFHRKSKCGAPLAVLDELRYCQSCWDSGSCHHEKCAICRKAKGGPLFLCDRCPNVTHLECMKEEDAERIDQQWTCHLCECAVCHSGINVECVCMTCKRGFHSECLDVNLQGVIECSDCIIALENHPESLLGWRMKEGTEEREVYCRLKDRSYIHCKWLDDSWLKEHVAAMRTIFWKKNPRMIKDERDLMLQDYTTVGRVVDISDDLYLIKWAGLYYDELTWEALFDVEHLAGFKDEVARYKTRCNQKSTRRHFAISRDFTDFKEITETPEYVGGTLYPHQIIGANFLVANWYMKRNCILADEMGLGKTCQSLVLLATIEHLHGSGPFLIVVPMSTMRNWERETRRFAPNLDVVMLYGNEESRKNMWKYERKPCVVITTYDVARRDATTLLKKKWAVLIVDEGHSLKNTKAILYTSLEDLNADYRVLLTGTPVQNRVAELVSMLQFLQVDEVNGQDEDEVDRMYNLTALREEGKLEELHRLVRPYVLRRVKEDVDLGIPKRVEVIVPVSLTAVQLEHYKYALKSNYGVLVESKSLKKGFANNLLMSLRHICNHPYLILEEEPQFETVEQEYEALIAASGKVALLDRMLAKLTDAGHRVLIFSQFVRVLDLLDDYMNYRNYLFERIDGNTTLENRQLAIDRFNEPGSERQVFLLSTKATSLGINLATADTVIMFDSDWNPQNDLQAIHRAHRLGQKNIVLLLVLMTANSAEEHLLSRARSKRVLEHLVIGKLNKKLDKEELSRSIEFGAENIISGRIEQIEYTDDDLDQLLNRDAQLLMQEEKQNQQGVEEKTFLFSKVWEGAAALDKGNEVSLVKRSDTFWKEVLGDLDEERRLQNSLVLKTKRKRRKVVHYFDPEEFVPEEVKEEEEEGVFEPSEESEQLPKNESVPNTKEVKLESQLEESNQCHICFGDRGHSYPCVPYSADPFFVLHVNEKRALKIPYAAAFSVAHAMINNEIKATLRLSHPADGRSLIPPEVLIIVETWMNERTTVNLDRPSNTGATCFAVCCGQKIPKNIEKMLYALWKENPCRDERFLLRHPSSYALLPIQSIAQSKTDGVELVRAPRKSIQDLVQLAAQSQHCVEALKVLGLRRVNQQ